jgi:Carboxypeptidase regulatory-like domain/TonB dependent receptor
MTCGRGSRLALLTLTSLLFFGIFSQIGWAQKDSGNIVGTIRDSSGALVAGAKVTVHDVDHNLTFNFTTNESGEFVSGPLPVGKYEVTVERQGFKKAVSNVIELQVQQRVPVNVTLQVGQATQVVEVTSATPLLETETSELGQVVDSRRVANLPLNGRNFAQLALLTPGVTPSEPGARDENSYGFSANGARSLQNNFLLDGVDNNSNLPDLLNETNYVIQPPVEALQEFKVQTNSYSAEFGRGNGAIVNAVIKSGTNSFHGSAWEFFRNEKLDARNFFDDPTKPTPPYKQNQFGATFGGPILKNKLFFFVDYEGLRVRQAQTQSVLIPTPDEVGGNFASLIDYTTQITTTAADGATQVPALDCNGKPTYAGEIFDTRRTQSAPQYQTGLCGVPFSYNAAGLPQNVIPATPTGGGSIDPLAQKLANLYPAPNVFNTPGINYLANPVESENRNNFDVRVDQRITDKDFTFYRFSYEDQPSTIPGTFPGIADGGGFFSGIEDDSYRSVAASWTHYFNTTLINEFRLGYNRINSHRFQFNYNQDVSSQVGFPGVPFTPIIGGLPQLTFSDVAQLGSPTFLPSQELQNTYVLAENLTWVKGQHTLKFGTEIRREEFTIFQPASPRGNLDFSPQFTDNPAAPGSGGSGFASFMAGLTDGGSINNLHNVDYFRPIYAFYGQDDWKISSHLTLNLGLRYELFTTVKERNNNQGTFDLNDPSNPTVIIPKGVTAQLTPTLSTQIALSPTASRGLISPDTNNFAPRIGLAYQLQEKTVVRAGYGIFYGGQENGPYSNPSPGFNPPFFVTQAFNTPCSAASANPSVQDCTVPGLSSLQTGFPSNALSDPNTPTLFSIDPRLVTPYMQQWHLSVQHELPAASVFEITYAGSKGNKLFTFLNGNQAAPSADPNAPLAPRRPVPAIDAGIDWFRSSGASSYNSLQLSYEKRFTHGLSFTASYTWAHSIDNASNANLGPTQNNSDFRYFADPQAEFGNSDFGVRNRFVVSYLYELPFGKGKAVLGDASGAVNQIVSGWQIGGITSVSSGNWFTVLDSNGDFANSDGGAGGVSQRPDQVGDPNGARCVPGTFFNTCAFADPALGSFGNVRRNTLAGPGYQIWDFSVFKHFQLNERFNLEFRSEFFNIANHTNYLLAKSGPQESNNATVLGTPQFGFLTAARAPRQIQLALKLSF